MQIAGIIYNQKRKEAQEGYQKAVERADFLDAKEKKKWGLLGFVLQTKELDEARKLIINEHLRRLKMKESLEKIKAAQKRKNG